MLFRQDFGGPAPAIDSMVTVGIGNGAVQYVSSSLARSTATSVAAADALRHRRLAEGGRQRRPRR